MYLHCILLLLCEKICSALSTMKVSFHKPNHVKMSKTYFRYTYCGLCLSSCIFSHEEPKCLWILRKTIWNSNKNCCITGFQFTNDPLYGNSFVCTSIGFICCDKNVISRLECSQCWNSDTIFSTKQIFAIR